ncbi:hypothetical protein KIPB_002870, partial [Kipferlia bialata]
YLGLTDHDTVAGVQEAREEAALHPSLHLVSGVEMSCGTHPDMAQSKSVHIVVYYEGPLPTPMAVLMADRLRDRKERAAKILDRLAGLDMDVRDRLVLDGPASDCIGRPHIARALVDSGHCTDMNECFDRWLGDDCPAFVDMPDPLTAVECVSVASSCGMVCVWAHPLQSGLSQEDGLDEFLSELVEAGLWGIECLHPDNAEAQRETQYLMAAAEKYGLGMTAGSDYHGTNKPELALGRGQVDHPFSAPIGWGEALQHAVTEAYRKRR